MSKVVRNVELVIPRLSDFYNFHHDKVLLYTSSYFCWSVSYSFCIICSLRPSTQKVLSLAAELKAPEKDKEHLRINLCKAEEEVRKAIETNPAECFFPYSSTFYCVVV